MIGQAAFSFLIMGLGLLGLFSRQIFAALFLILSLAGLFGARDLFPGPASVKTYFREMKPLEWICAALVFYVLLLAALSAGSPATDWDSLAYHLAFPKIFLREGRLSPLEWSFNIHYPINPEMISTLLFALRGENSVQWMNFLQGLLLLAAVYSIASKSFGRSSAALACAVLACQPVFLRVNGNASSDFAVALASVLAVRSLLEGGSTWVTGFLAGAAASSKLTGLWTAGALALLHTVRSPSPLLGEGPRRRRGGEGVKFLAGAAAFGFPWYLRNWIWKGNPFWPYFGGIFGADPQTLLLAERSRLSVTEGVSKTVLNWLGSPFALIFRPDAFGQPAYFWTAVFLILLIWRLWRIRTKPLVPAEKPLLLFMVFFWTFWFWVYQMWRYFLPASALGCVLMAAWLKDLYSQGGAGKWIAAALAAWALSPLVTLKSGSQIYAFFGVKSKAAPEFSARRRYLELTLGPSYAVVRKANEVLPPDSKVVLYGEVRGFYLDRDYAWGDPLNPGAIDFSKVASASDIYESLKGQGFTHFLYNPYIGNYHGSQMYYNRAEGLITQFLARYVTPLIDEKGIVLGRLK